MTDLVRPNIQDLTPYRCARNDYSDGVLLDANENSYGSTLAPGKVGPIVFFHLTYAGRLPRKVSLLHAGIYMPAC